MNLNICDNNILNSFDASLKPLSSQTIPYLTLYSSLVHFGKLSKG